MRALRFLAALWFLLAGAAWAAAPLPPATSLLVDEAGVLSPEAKASITARLQRMQAGGRAQVGVLIARDTRELPLADFSLEVVQAWKLGHAGRDDGLLVVIVPKPAQARMEVGYGLEGWIPDVLAAHMLQALMQDVREGEVEQGLRHLIDAIDVALPPPPAAPAKEPKNILDRHPEWKLPFVFAIFSPFALFPLFFGRWGCVASAPLFAGMIGASSWSLWESRNATIAVASVAFVLPLLWSFNHRSRESMKGWKLAARDIGNAAAVAIFFSILAMFVGVGLSGQREATWAALLFAATMALGLAAVLFPGRPQWVLMRVLRSLMHFVIVLLIAYFALTDVVPDPAPLAFGIAGSITALIVLVLVLDGTKASLWLMAFVLLAMLPLGALLMLHAALGEDFNTRLVQAASGGGSLAAVLWWAARHGFFAALRIGLGGRFGGAGADER